MIGYELSSSNPYSVGGRTMVQQMNTPTKHSVIHGNGAGLFASYNRSIPKTNQAQGTRIRIDDLSYKNDQTYQQDDYTKKIDKTKNLNTTKGGVKKDITDFRVRSASSNKKYRYNDPGNSSPGNVISSGKKKKKKTFKGNYGEPHTNEQKESILQSALDRNLNKVTSNDHNYINVKNTIASTSSKKTSNNTSWLVSTSSRNASITPRKIISKVMANASPEMSNNQAVDRFDKTYLANSKIQRSKIKPKAVKLSNKHKMVKEKPIRESSGSNRKKLTLNEQDPLNNTGSKVVMDNDSYQKIINELGKSELRKMGVITQQDNASMPSVSNKHNPTLGIYGSFKTHEEKHKFSTSKKKEKAGYNAHPSILKKGLANRNILKAKMEVRTTV
jgi:hypothetical protein